MAAEDKLANASETKTPNDAEFLAFVYREDTPIEKQLADDAEAEILRAVSTCEAADYSQESCDALWGAFDRWLNDARLLTDASSLRVRVLTELTARLWEEHLGGEAWEIFRKLARKYSNNDPEGMGISLTISTFELFAEPPEVPEVPETLRLLFSLAGDPETRWAVFAAYKNTPSRLRSHAAMYSGGSVTDADCDEWFRKQWIREFEDLNPH